MRGLGRRMLLSLAITVLAACGRLGHGGAASADGVDVYVVIVDGLGADFAVPEHMPALAAAASRRGTWLTATAVMPTLTNPNHVSLLTGAYPEVHGITGNRYWNGREDAELEDPGLIEVETIFTAIERQRPTSVTAAAFGKSKVRRLFAAAPGQHAPDVAWHPTQADAYADDATTMTAFRELVRTHRPSLAVVAIADLDRAGHLYGPASPAYAATVAQADAQIGALLKDLHDDRRWRRSVVFVTADHGFDELRAGRSWAIETRSMNVGGTEIVSDCRVAHVYADPRHPNAPAATAAWARRQPGIGGVYVSPLPPEWHLRHERAGGLLLVARPGFAFVGAPSDPTRGFRGNHGGPGERFVPLVVVGGHPALRKAPGPATPQPSSVDLAPTIARLLGIDPPRRLDGRPIPASSHGRVLEELFAQVEAAR